MTWKNWKIYAIDGTVENLPQSKQLKKYFGGPSNKKGKSKRPQARLVSIVSVLCGFCMDFTIMPYASSEHEALYKLLLRLKKGDLLLLDRGFFSYIAINRMLKNNIEFIMRVPKRLKFKVIKQIRNGDAIIEITPSQVTRYKWKELPEEFQVRYIKYQIKGFRPTYLITSISDPSILTKEEIKELYHKRWGIETVYRELKHVIDIQNIRSKTQEGVKKENYVHLILNNLIRWIMTEASEKEGCNSVDLSFQEAVRAVQDALPLMAIASPAKIIQIYLQVIERIRMAKILKRPGRYYKRKICKTYG